MLRKILLLQRKPLHVFTPTILSQQCFSISQITENDKQCHYEILGIPKSASVEEIRTAYVNKSKEFHPDSNIEDPNAHDTFVKINEAYSVLKCIQLRSAYDLQNTPGFTSNISATNPFGTYHEERNNYDAPNYAAARDYDFTEAQPKRENLMKNWLLVCVLLSFSVVGSWLLYLRVRHVHDTQSEHLEKLSRQNIALHKQLREDARRNGAEKQLALFIAKVSPQKSVIKYGNETE